MEKGDRVRKSKKEVSSNKEIITPDAIRQRVMEYFQGVDLNGDGGARVGLIDVSTIKSQQTCEIPKLYIHKAEVNGLRIAEYEHVSEEVGGLLKSAGKYARKFLDKSLSEERAGEIAHYELNGYSNGMVRVLLKEFVDKKPEITVACPFVNDGKETLLENVGGGQRAIIASKLGIKTKA